MSFLGRLLSCLELRLILKLFPVVSFENRRERARTDAFRDDIRSDELVWPRGDQEDLVHKLRRQFSSEKG